METRVAVLAIIVRGGSSVQPLNELLHQYGQYIIGRMGVPYREKGVNIISVALDAPGNVISALSGKIGRLDGITAKRSTRPRAASERKKTNEKESQISLGPVPDDCARLLARRLRTEGGRDAERRAGRPADRTGGVHPCELLHRRAQGPDGHGPCEADEGQRKRRNDWQ